MHDADLRQLVETRVHRPQAIAEAAARRRAVPADPSGHGKLMIIAADHPARGALRAGAQPFAMANRADLLDRLCLALSRPGVNGVLGTPDILEDLLLLGALDGKMVIGSMNRGGLAGTTFEIDDRFTAYDAGSIAASGFDGGKMLIRIDPDDPATATWKPTPAALVSSPHSSSIVHIRPPHHQNTTTTEQSSPSQSPPASAAPPRRLLHRRHRRPRQQQSSPFQTPATPIDSGSHR